MVRIDCRGERGVEYTMLGRTGLRVSVMGLGGGGHSRLGLGYGAGEENAEAVVREALDLGVNIIDTAESYGTEPAVGRATEGCRRADLVLCTKKTPTREGAVIGLADLRRGLEESLRRLRTDYVDVYQLHGVSPDLYEHARDTLVPCLMKLREEGKVRFLGITEGFGADPRHRMLSRAVNDDCWDVVMVGFNILNQSARRRVLETTRSKGIGVLNMFAVRRAFSRPERLKEIVADLAKRSVVDAGSVDAHDPVGFLVGEGHAGSVTEAAYRFCRWEPGLDVVLCGTGSVEHLRANARSLCMPDLPAQDRARLEAMFARVDDVTGG
jgi:L-galactose dehydrogenase